MNFKNFWKKVDKFVMCVRGLSMPLVVSLLDTLCVIWRVYNWIGKLQLKTLHPLWKIIQRFSRAGPRGRAREWATLGVHPLSWLLSNNRLEDVCGTFTKGTFSSRLLLSNQDKGCTPSVAHSLPLQVQVQVQVPLPPSFCSTCQVKKPTRGWISSTFQVHFTLLHDKNFTPGADPGMGQFGPGPPFNN